jgi:3-dehydroquinate dehydratase-2
MSKQPKIFILNGPNTNVYGLDPNGVYGSETLADIEARCRKRADELRAALEFRQTNHEGVLIDWVHEARRDADGLIVNAGSASYASIGILDALLAFGKPIIEVHMTNIYKREAFRQHSFISKAASGIIAGFGPLGYELAVTAVITLLAEGRAS